MYILNNVSFEVNPVHIRQRIWQIIPGFLSWGTFISLAVLSFFVPFWIAIFIIVFDVYILIRIAYMSTHLLYAYRNLNLYKDIDWLKRCKAVSGDLKKYLEKLENKISRIQKSKNTKRYLKQLIRHHEHVSFLLKKGHRIMSWEKVHHIIVLPTYDESLDILRPALRSLSETDFPKERMHVVVGFEERAGEEARQRADVLTQEFGKNFGTFLTTFHPDGLPGEKKVKSANASWAVKKMEAKLLASGIKIEQILVSNFDSDTVTSPTYFSYLTYAFITHPNRYRTSYQPIPLYNNNLWDAPAFSRVVATGSTFWQMIESMRPERLVTFSSHSMTLKALRDVGYWQPNVVSEDSRIFWQCLLHYDGNYRAEPLYTTVSMDAALAPGWWQTLKNQYKQKRRWAWGIENFPFLAEGFLKNKNIPFWTKVTYIFRTLEGHYSWATAAIIVAGLGWLPILLGGPDFHATFLSYSLPALTRTLMSIAMAGLIISAALGLLLLPPRPHDYGKWRYVFIVFQWALVPLIATLLSAFPALDAETRLMLGRDLHFNVMKKSRKRINNEVPKYV